MRQHMHDLSLGREGIDMAHTAVAPLHSIFYCSLDIGTPV